MIQLVGKQIGRYHIQQEIGRGGMARVYRALDTALQRPVALKVLAPQLSMDPEFARRFKREAVIAANLHHPAIVTIYDIDEYTAENQLQLHYIAMEFIQGRSLHAILEDRDALGLGYAVPILEPLGRALDYAHSRGAVHRDVKPHNVMIDVEGRVLLTDFGIAQPPDADTERLTRTGVFMGTPEYISPEQAEARRVDGRSDLYSLGVVAYEIITGRVPFSGATPQLIIAHSQTPPPPPSRIVPYLPSELDTVLMQALAKNPNDRFNNGATLVEVLRSVAERYSIPLATSQHIADLVRPRDSSGQPTISLGKGQTPAALPPALIQPPAQPPVVATARPLPHTGNNDNWSAPTPVPPRVPTPVPPPGWTPAPVPGQTGSPAPAPRRSRLSPNQIAVGIALILLALALFMLFQRGANRGEGTEVVPTAPLPTLETNDPFVPTAAPPPTDEAPSPTDEAPTEEPTAAPPTAVLPTAIPPTLVPPPPPILLPPPTIPLPPTEEPSPTVPVIEVPTETVPPEPEEPTATLTPVPPPETFTPTPLPEYPPPETPITDTLPTVPIAVTSTGAVPTPTLPSGPTATRVASATATPPPEPTDDLPTPILQWEPEPTEPTEPTEITDTELTEEQSPRPVPLAETTPPE